MKNKKTIIKGLALIVFSAIFLSSCSPLSILSGSIPVAPSNKSRGATVPATSPEFARDAVLEYLRVNYEHPTPAT